MLSSLLVLQWVADDSPSKSTPIRVENANQFVPLGTSKKEFKKIQAAVSSMSKVIHKIHVTVLKRFLMAMCWEASGAVFDEA